MARLELHPDRLLPAEPAVRSIARELYAAVADQPLVSPYSRISAGDLAADLPATDPTRALIAPADALVRLLRANGVPLAGLDRPDRPDTEPTTEASRAVFAEVCSHWDLLKSTPARLWLETELVEVYGFDLVPSAETADELYDAVAARLEQPDMRSRALFDRLGIQLLATLDDPCSELADHAALAGAAGGGQVIPTFCPDPYLAVGDPGWRQRLDQLAAVAAHETGDYPGWLTAIGQRRAAFRGAGAVAAVHTMPDSAIEPVSEADAHRLYAVAHAGRASRDEAAALTGHLLFEQARMASDDGLVMVLRPAQTAPAGGCAPGPRQVLASVLDAFGDSAYFQVVAFPGDPAAAVELAALAGRQPSVYLGQPWHLLEAPEATQLWRARVGEVLGFGRTSGFVDNAASLASIPARHDTSRRLDAGWLAGLVATHRLTLEQAYDAATELVIGNPRKAFKL